MQYQVIIFSILLAGVSECIGAVASEDGLSNAASINVGASSLLRPTRQAVDVTGGLASTADYPFAAFITWYWTQTRIQRNIRPRNLTVTLLVKYECSGALVGLKYVITTAVCFQPKILELYKSDHAVLKWTPSEAWVRGGANDGWRGGLPQSQMIDVAKIYIHEDYVMQTVMYDVDIALVQLKEPFVFEDHVKPPKISTGFHEMDRMKCRVVGFGRTNPTDRSTKRPLHSYPVVMGGYQYCHRLQNEFDGSSFMFDTFFICGKPNSTTPGTECFEDMGAPVMCGNMLTGILSRRRQNSPCGGTKDFSMYMMVGHDLVAEFLRNYVGDDEVTVFRLPTAEVLEPLGLDWGQDRSVAEKSASSSMVLGSKITVVALVAFTGIRAA